MKNFPAESIDLTMEAFRGARISKDDAAMLEARLAASPDDKQARAALLGFYSFKRQSKATRLKGIRHILWMLEHEPGSGLGATPAMCICKKEAPREYELGKQLVLRQCEVFRTHATVLADLACFFRYDETALAVRFLRQAYSVAGRKDKDHIAFTLSLALHRLGREENDPDAFRESVELMQQVVAKEKRTAVFDKRAWLARLAYVAKHFDLARETCDAMLADNIFNDQSVHVAHSVLGLMELDAGDVASASQHLKQAGKVGKSPRLVSYGPATTLARRLLERGETEVVLQYLRDCKKLWQMGRHKLTKWIAAIERGESPNMRGDDWD